MKKVFLASLCVMVLFCTGCGSTKVDNKDKETKKVQEEKDDFINNNKSYFFSINGKKIYAGNKISSISKYGYELREAELEEKVPANKYMIGAGYMVNSDKKSVFNVTPYNSKSDSVLIKDSEIGGFSINYATAKIDEDALKIEVYGGIKLGSTQEEVEKAFGKPTSQYEGTSYVSYKYDSDEVYRSFTIRFDTEKNNTVSSIEWKNLVYNK